ncbi:MAG: helix-turn-helix transcriptional regulator [Hyphomicrobiales bacterium]|nr:helix-turn-helix transcriptional regulator [Hyphomicrobiales bacterium]MBV8426988.1 helix-turn-helix transcriptional regulator [Hyphomicrobiales bacterium]
MKDKDFDRGLGTRLRFLREGQGLSLGALAERSGVSKAMIARVEKAQSSPTAALLGRLCAGLGVRLSSLIEAADRRSEPLSRFRDQPAWRDPKTGYLRRQVSPSGASSGLEIASISLPPGKKVPYRAWTANAYRQQLVMLAGTLHLQMGNENYVLRKGDCLDFDVLSPNTFENKGRACARYLIVIRKD